MADKYRDGGIKMMCITVFADWYSLYFCIYIYIYSIRLFFFFFFFFGSAIIPKKKKTPLYYPGINKIKLYSFVSAYEGGAGEK